MNNNKKPMLAARTNTNTIATAPTNLNTIKTANNVNNVECSKRKKEYSIPFLSNSDTNVSRNNNLTTFNELRKATLLKTTWNANNHNHREPIQRSDNNNQVLGSFGGKCRATVVHQKHLNKIVVSNPESRSSSSCEKCKGLNLNSISFDETLISHKSKFSRENSEESSSRNSRKSSYEDCFAKSDGIFYLEDNSRSKSLSEKLKNSGGVGGGHELSGVLSDKEELEDMKSSVSRPQKRLMKFENVIESDDENNLNNTTSHFNYKVLRNNDLSEGEIDQLISKLLIDNLNNVIQTVNENIQHQKNPTSNGGQRNNLVQIIDYKTTNVKGGLEDGAFISSNSGGLIYSKNTNNNSSNNNTNNIIKHENQIHRNEDTQNLNELNIPILPVYSGSFENADVLLKPNNHYAHNKLEHQDSSYTIDGNIDELDNKNYSLSYHGGYDRSIDSVGDLLPETEEIGTLINTGSSYKELVNGVESILIPRLSAFPRTASMEVQPSSTSETNEDEFEGYGLPDSDDDDLSLVDSLDDFTIRMNKMTRMQLQQERAAQNMYLKPPLNLKPEAFFVPIVDTEQQLDEHIPLQMPDKLKEKLTLRQRRRQMKKQTEITRKQWKLQKYVERKIGDIKFEENSGASRGSFKVIGIEATKAPIPIPKKVITFSKPESLSGSGSGSGGGTAIGWMPKARPSPLVLPPAGTRPNKSKKLRNEIGMLESYKIDGRGNMQIQAPIKSDPTTKPPIGRRPEPKRFVSAKTKPPLHIPMAQPRRRSSSFLKSTTSSLNNLASNLNINSPTSSGERFFDESIIDARRKQVMKDVQQMTSFKSGTGPMRKMFKTEIRQGEKHIEILEIVECDGNPSSLAPLSSLSQIHTMNVDPAYDPIHSQSNSNSSVIVNKRYSSRIPVPIFRSNRSKLVTPTPSSGTSSTPSMSGGNGSNKVDRMIADLLMEALQSPETLDNINFVRSPKLIKSKRLHKSKLMSPIIHLNNTSNANDNNESSPSTGYGTGDSLTSRRSANNSGGANKYLQRFEVIPEEKSSYSYDSSSNEGGVVEDTDKDEQIEDVERPEEEEMDENCSKSNDEDACDQDDNPKIQKNIENNEIKESLSQKSDLNISLSESNDAAMIVESSHTHEIINNNITLSIHKTNSINITDSNNNETDNAKDDTSTTPIIDTNLKQITNKSFPSQLPDNFSSSSPKLVSPAKPRKPIIPTKSPKVLRKIQTESKIKLMPPQSDDEQAPPPPSIPRRKSLQFSKSNSVSRGSLFEVFKDDKVTFQPYNDSNEEDEEEHHSNTGSFKEKPSDFEGIQSFSLI